MLLADKILIVQAVNLVNIVEDQGRVENVAGAREHNTDEYITHRTSL